MKKQPGVMLYFDIRDALAQLSDGQKGQLLDAILDYGQHHSEPAFADPALALVWPFVRKDIHRDAIRYRTRQEQARQAANRRWGKDEPLDEEMRTDADACEEMRTDANACERMRTDANVCEVMRKMPSTPTPTPAPATTPPPPSPPASAAAPSTAAAADASAASSSTTPPVSALPRTNPSALPDLVAQFLPPRRPAADTARLKAEALAKLRALPPDDW